jgi:hypothetical protein
MSGIVSGITKVFTSVGSAVARVGQSVAAVGASVFTTGAATGAGSMASGALSATARTMGGGVLGNVINGAIKQGAIGAIIGGGISALTGNGFGKGALIGGIGGLATGGLTGYAQSGTGLAPNGVAAAETATGVAPTGVTQSSPLDARFGDNSGVTTGGRSGLAAGLEQQQAAMTGAAGAGVPAAANGLATAPAAVGGGGGLMGFLQSEGGGNIISGLGQGAMGYFNQQQQDKQLKLQAEQYDKNRAAELDKEMRIRDSYDMGDAAYETPYSDDTKRPTPEQAFGRGRRYEYDAAKGRVVSVAA